MDASNLPSDSDESDLDYKPSDNEIIPSEEESDNCVDEDQVEEAVCINKKSKKRKNKRISKKRSKIAKADDEDDKDSDDSSKIKKSSSPAEEKQKADSLWADFMKDCGPTIPKRQSSNGHGSAESRLEPFETKPSISEKENKVKVTEIFDFAGEKICVEKEVAPESIGVGLVSGRGRGRGRGSGVSSGRGRGRGGSGIASILGQLGKKSKLSTLEKSKLDWETFKTDQGIKEDIEKHNKGKNGYLERQDFLQRSDLRQFEKEKELRTTHRSNR